MHIKWICVIRVRIDDDGRKKSRGLHQSVNFSSNRGQSMFSSSSSSSNRQNSYRFVLFLRPYHKMILSFDRPPAPLGWRQALDPLGKKRSREELSGRLARKDTFEVERQEEEE